MASKEQAPAANTPAAATTQSSKTVAAPVSTIVIPKAIDYSHTSVKTHGLSGFLLKRSADSIGDSKATQNKKAKTASEATTVVEGGEEVSAPTNATAVKIKGGRTASGLFYKFHQGFSNAVKRTVTIEDFL